MKILLSNNFLFCFIFCFIFLLFVFIIIILYFPLYLLSWCFILIFLQGKLAQMLFQICPRENPNVQQYVLASPSQRNNSQVREFRQLCRND